VADLGTDFSCVLDLDFNLTMVSGRRALAECVARRWLTIGGTLVYDRAAGAGLLNYLESEDRDVAQLGGRLEAEALEDERVENARVTVTLEDGELRVFGKLSDADGDFALTLTVDGVTTQLLIDEAT